MDVKIKDRKREVEYLRMALNVCEIGVDYTHTDLIIRVYEKLKVLDGKFSISDGVDILYDWKQEWQSYFDKQSVKEDQ